MYWARVELPSNDFALLKVICVNVSVLTQNFVVPPLRVTELSCFLLGVNSVLHNTNSQSLE
eukprot:m.2069 g.2069  ORF g.2069 m.2069 type:complete len:61 (+) comp1474_c0_seq1:63-245(+)